MAAPSKSWTPIIDTKIDADSPVTEELKTFERDNGVHNDERIGIPAAPAQRTANHAHKGLDNDGSAVIELTPQENLIDAGDRPNTTDWVAVGGAVAGAASFFKTAGNEFLELRRSTGAGAYLNQLVHGLVSANIEKKIKSASGKGRFTCSVHMKRDPAATGVVGGTFRFGIWDNSAYVTGAFVDIDFDDVTTEYKRFFFISDQFARPTAVGLRIAVQSNPSDWDTISNGDVFGFHGGYMINNGAGLAKWDISHFDGAGDDYNADAENQSYWWDEVITQVQLTP